MERGVTILKREIGSADLEFIQGLIKRFGHRGRTYISKELCRLWDWRLPNGQLRDIAGRDLLRRLERRGLIQLPPPIRAARKPGYKNKTILPQDFTSTPVIQSLQHFSSIDIEMVRGSSNESLYNALIGSYHYLGYHQGA
ncbi:hypothetical protein JW998_06305, partial [candidate division KSB1 bacterium]|nr:hypothetical protein [candidate division KSB1 bacterium]